MSNGSQLWVILGNDSNPQKLFYREIKAGNTHAKELMQFVKEYNIHLEFTENDYHEAPCMIAEAGHLVVETISEDSKVRIFLPQKLTNDQFNFFSQICLTIPNYEKVRCYSLMVLGEDGMMWKNIRNMEQVINEVNSKSKVMIRENKGKLR